MSGAARRYAFWGPVHLSSPSPNFTSRNARILAGQTFGVVDSPLFHIFQQKGFVIGVVVLLGFLILAYEGPVTLEHDKKKPSQFVLVLSTKLDDSIP